jgi:hypothetical protein
MAWAMHAAGPAAHPSVLVVARWCRRCGSRLARLLATQRELEERRLLAHHPWEEDFLHWSADGRLHGTLSPPDGRRRSVSRLGWCPGPVAPPRGR